MTLNQKFGYAFGSVYVLVGLLGFAVTGGVGFAATSGNNLIFFELNPLHNLVHLAVGGLFIAGAAAGAAASKGVNILIGAVYLLVGAVGLFILDSSLNILALNHPDNLLHLVTAAGALAIGMSRQRSVSAA